MQENCTKSKAFLYVNNNKLNIILKAIITKDGHQGLFYKLILIFIPENHNMRLNQKIMFSKMHIWNY